MVPGPSCIVLAGGDVGIYVELGTSLQWRREEVALLPATFRREVSLIHPQAECLAHGPSGFSKGSPDWARANPAAL